MTKAFRLWWSENTAEPLALRDSLKSFAGHVQPFLTQLALQHVVPAVGHRAITK